MVQVVVIALIGAFVVVYLRSINSELSMFALIGTGILVLICAFEYLSESISVINKLVELSGINKEFYVIIFKITAIGYLVEFAADTINDLGLKGLADKLVFTGKILVFSISLPIIYSICNLLVSLLQ